MSELSNGQQLKLQVYSNMVQKYTHNAVLLAMVRMVEVVRRPLLEEEEVTAPS